MSHVESQPRPAGTHWVYKMLAVLLTLSIVVVVFWQTKPGGDQSGDTGGNPTSSSMPTEIDEMGTNQWRASSGQAFVFVAGDPADRFEFRMRLFGLIDGDTRTLIRAHRMLMQDETARKAVELTPEQWLQIQAISVPRLVVSDEDRSEFESRWRAWQRADAAHKQAAKAAVLERLGDIGRKGVEPTRRAWADAGEKLRKTLTLQQMARLSVYMDSVGGAGRGFGNPFAPSPTSQPAR